MNATLVLALLGMFALAVGIAAWSLAHARDPARARRASRQDADGDDGAVLLLMAADAGSDAGCGADAGGGDGGGGDGGGGGGGCD